MKNYLVKAVDYCGREDSHVEAVVVEGEFQSEEEILKCASKRNPLIKEVLLNEPQQIVFGSDGKIMNVEEIKTAMYIIIVPLRM